MKRKWHAESQANFSKRKKNKIKPFHRQFLSKMVALIFLYPKLEFSNQITFPSLFISLSL